MTRRASIRLSRTVQLPDRRKLARMERAPELGPNILFFSGGSALNPLSRVLVRYTHNSTHLITPFDSGGSSAKLRKAFNMPAVGDLRNRMMALADRTVQGNPEVGRLFSTRFGQAGEAADLQRELDEMVSGRHPLVARIPDPMRKIVRSHLGFVAQALPPDFDLRGASIGNLALVGGYLNQGRHLDPVIYMFSKLAAVRGTVRPVVSHDLHLAAELENGQRLVGQHLLTGREAPPISSAISNLYLTEDLSGDESVRPVIREKIRKLIASAELICFPMGSFYSSLIATLLPRGVAEAIRENGCPKVFIPNTGIDSEMLGGGVAFQVKELLRYLNGNNGRFGPEGLLQYVLVDTGRGRYPNGVGAGEIKALGVELVDAPLAGDGDGERLDPEALNAVLLSLA